MLAGAPEPTPETIFVDRYKEIAEYLNVESERLEAERKAKIKEEQRLQRLYLDEQVRLLAERNAREKADEQKFIEFERDKRDRWNSIDKMKRAEMKEKEVAQKLARDAQIREVESRKAAQRRTAGDSERETLARIREELAAERVLRLSRRFEEKDNMARIVEQNERNLAIAAETRHKAFLDNQRVGIEYKRILDGQERERLDSLASTQARMQMQAVNASHLYDAIAVEGARDLERAKATQAANAAARDAELAARDERRRELQKECQAVLQLQVTERKAAGLRHKREESALVRLEAEANAAALAHDRAEVGRRKDFNKSYRDELAYQVKTDRVRRQMVGYTLPIAEMQMNSALLKKVAAASLLNTQAERMRVRAD